jgi:AAA+ superfamily predicted ATPase
MNPELNLQIRALSRVIYFVTDEEDQFLLKLRAVLKKSIDHTFVFDAAVGLRPLTEYVDDWKSRKHETAEDKLMNINQALIEVYKADPKNFINFYVFTDPEVHLENKHVQRRVLRIIHQLNADIRNIKILIFVGTAKYIPPSLQRYVQVVHDKGLTSEEIHELVTEACGPLKMPVPSPDECGDLFRGMTTFEIKTAIAQSVIRAKNDGLPLNGLNPALLHDFKKQAIQRTDLVQYIDTSHETFENVGGAQWFKHWATKTRAAWTPEGKKFGLKPPKGVLCVGIWGCGKSLSVKALGHAWGMPVVQLEMGRLRSGTVGGSEGNIYRALRIIEAAAPCVVWIDEAEKSLSGMQSSAQTDSGITARIIGIFSTWLQETNAPVCLAMTANGLKTLPVEFVNRMDERFYFSLPNDEDRVDILKIHLRKAGQDPVRFHDLVALADKAKDLVGREIEQAVGAAMIESFHQGRENLDEEILAEVLQRKPRIVRTMPDEIKELEEWVGYDQDTNDGIRARFAAPPKRNKPKFTSVSGG